MSLLTLIFKQTLGDWSVILFILMKAGQMLYLTTLGLITPWLTTIANKSIHLYVLSYQPS